MDMKDWSNNGEIVGFWLQTGEKVQTTVRERPLISDWAPFTLKGKAIVANWAKKKKKSGSQETKKHYWKFHLPVCRKRVQFHRQLICDFSNQDFGGKDIDHGDHGLDYNCVSDLTPVPSKPHRQKHGKQGGRPKGRKRKRPW